MVKNRKWPINFSQDLSIKLKNYSIDRLWSFVTRKQMEGEKWLSIDL